MAHSLGSDEVYSRDIMIPEPQSASSFSKDPHSNLVRRCLHGFPRGEDVNTIRFLDISTSTTHPSRCSVLSICHLFANGASGLVSLPCFDQAEDGSFGLHEGTASSICFLLLGNKHGLLVPAEEHKKKPTFEEAEYRDRSASDRVLPAGKYFLYSLDRSTGKSYNYPIVPTFREWMIPEQDEFPEAWRTMRPSTNEFAEGRCRVTDWKESIKNAHLVPQAEKLWFDSSSIVLTSRLDITSRELIDSISNIVQIRSDVHRFFDKPGWFFSTKQGKFVVHFLMDSEDLGPLLHNCEASISTKSVMCIFARFAWALFSFSYRWTHSIRDIKYLKQDGTTIPIQDYQFPSSRPSKRPTTSATPKSATEPVTPRGQKRLVEQDFDFEMSRLHKKLDQHKVDHENELRFGGTLEV